jgi:metal-dependent amidase/aminoacylase/carboxypeptidase family protein
LGHILHAHAEYAVNEHQHRIIFLDQVDETGFHAGRAGAGHGNRQGVAGVEQGPKVGLDGIHDADKVRVKMADGSFAQGLVNLVMHAGGTGSHQKDIFNTVQ